MEIEETGHSDINGSTKKEIKRRSGLFALSISMDQVTKAGA